MGEERSEEPEVELRPAAHVAWREIGGEVFVVDLRSQQIFGLNGSGGEVWRALDEGRGPGPRARDFCLRLGELGLVEGEAPPEESFETLAGTWAPPEVVWQEPLRSFGFSCAFRPGEGRDCTRAPYE